ncbi:MAG: glycerol-3-phosphate 1-O-acyltransferase PlsY [Microgenomates group bacterium]
MPLITSGSTVLFIVGVLAYLLGSVPFGILITRLMGLGDLRQIGSGNIGATNVLRTGNKGAAAATLVLDGAKSAVAVLVARAMVGEDAAQVAGLMAFLGHLFPVWLRFKGGKGVATFLGAMLALAWPVGLALCSTWLVVAVVSRVSSLAALMSAALAGLWVFYFERFDLLAITLVFTVCVYARHWANLQRLKAGTEPKIGAKKA